MTSTADKLPLETEPVAPDNIVVLTLKPGGPRHRPEATGSTHHTWSRECPLPIYTALKIQGATRDRALTDAF